jgi:hypothetical protein
MTIGASVTFDTFLRHLAISTIASRTLGEKTATHRIALEPDAKNTQPLTGPERESFTFLSRDFCLLLAQPNMKLPGRESAIVPRSKVEDYLLRLEHPIGGGKAKFFIHYGFHRERWEELASALRAHGHENPVAKTLTDSDGIIYIIEGRMATPSERRPRIRAVWLLEKGELAPRLITAYPLGDDC